MTPKSQVLLVEDDLMVRDALKFFLEDVLSLSGYDAAVDCAASGEEALQKVQQQNYDLVLRDTQMGGIDGYEACAQIKEKNPERIVIGMSADRGYKQQWMAAGANDFVHKCDFTKSIKGILGQYLQKSTEMR